MIICTGSPKTGTHLLLKTVVLFGGECKLALHEHVPFAKKAEGTHLHIIRNPRNVVASWLKFNKQEVTEDNYIKVLPEKISEMSEYIGWLSDQEAFSVKFEELLTEPEQINNMADFLGLPPIENHFYKIWGGTSTFTGSLSNWRDFWTPAIAAAWVENGGLELEAALGYDVTKQWVRRV